MSTTLPGPTTCPQCGRVVPPLAPRGLCRACLAKLVVGGLEGAAQPSPDLQVPRFIGDYELLEEIGRGGMGVVWRARERKGGRIVALKLLLAGAYANEAAQERFRLEAELLDTLRHPNVVGVCGVGKHDGHPFYAMEYIEGVNLAQYIQETLPTARQAAQWMVILAAAVGHAHRHSIVHRDIKPANILLDALEVPHLTDFGLAKPLDAAHGLTLTGQALGTVSYMAPEQASGLSSGTCAAVDIYALGAVLYHLLTGRPPFLADTAAATIRQVMESDPVPPAELNPAIPAPLATICLKCLEKHPERRYASAQALAEDLQLHLLGEPIRARATGAWEKTSRWVRRNPLVTTLGLLLALALSLGLGVTLWQLRRAEHFLATSQVANARLAQSLARRDQQAAQEQFTRDRPLLGIAALARLVQDNPSNSLAAARLFNALATVPLPWPVLPPLVHADAVEQGEITADRQLILTASRDGLLHVWNASSAECCATLPHDTARGRFALSPDGKHVAVLTPNGGAAVWKLPEATLEFELGRDHSPPGNIACLTFSANGSLLAAAGVDGSVQLWDVPAGQPCHSFAINEPLQSAAFQTAGERLLVLGVTNCFVWDVSTTGGLASAALRFTIPSAGRLRLAAFSPQGDRLMTVASNRVELWDAGKRERLRLIELRTEVIAAAVNADGTSLALAGAVRRIWLYPANDQLRPESFSYRPRVHMLRFGFGGALLLGASDNGTASLWRAKGHQELTEPLRHQRAVLDACFSPARGKVLTASADRTARLWFVLRTTVRTTDLPGSDDAALMEWSSSGELLATAGADGAVRVYRAEDARLLAATPPQSGGMRSLAFDEGDRYLASVDNRGSLAVFEVKAAGLRPFPPAQHAVISQVKWGPRSLLAAATQTNAWLWEVSGTQAVQRACVPSGLVELMDFSANGQWWVVAGGNSAQVLDTRTGQAGGQRLEHPGTIGCIRSSPNGHWVATATAGGTVRVWEAATGKLNSSLIRPGGEVTCLNFSPDSELLALGTADGTVSLWEVRSGNLRRALNRGQRPVQSLEFSREGDCVLIAGDGLVRLVHADSALPVMKPFEVSSAATVRARFSQDNRRILVQGGNAPLLMSMKSPFVTAPNAGLLLAMAELVLGQRLTEQGSWQDLTTEEFFTRQRLLAPVNWRLGPDPQLRIYR